MLAWGPLSRGAQFGEISQIGPGCIVREWMKRYTHVLGIFHAIIANSVIAMCCNCVEVLKFAEAGKVVIQYRKIGKNKESCLTQGTLLCVLNVVAFFCVVTYVRHKETWNAAKKNSRLHLESNSYDCTLKTFCNTSIKVWQVPVAVSSRKSIAITRTRMYCTLSCLSST